MLKFLAGSVLAITAFGGLAMQAAPAAAMPMIDRTPALVAQEASPLVAPEQVRWVCGPYRCFHRPNFYGPRFYHPYWHRAYWPAHYWHRPYWHRPYWHHHYWHRPFWHHWHRGYGWHHHHWHR